MKIDKIIWWTIGFGILAILICILISVIMGSQSWWSVFCYLETGLGYIANLAIVAAAIRYISYEQLDIKGIAKIRIRRVHSNIQDLTNLLSREFFNGENFKRAPVLDAYYGAKPMDVISQDPELEKYKEESKAIIRLKVNGEVFEVKRSEIKTLDALINAVKYIYFDGAPLDNLTTKDIYKTWYGIK